MKNGVVWGGTQEHIIHKHQPAMNTQDNRPTKHPDADDSADAKQRQDSNRGVSIPDGSDDETELSHIQPKYFGPIQPRYPKYARPPIPCEPPMVLSGAYYIICHFSVATHFAREVRCPTILYFGFSEKGNSVSLIWPTTMS